MFTFAIRPGYGTKELLIEFLQGSGSDEMFKSMKAALAKDDGFVKSPLA
jgi:hypothetical protein